MQSQVSFFKKERKKRAEIFGPEVSWKVRGRRGRCPVLSGRHCRDRHYPLHVEMLRVLRSDPSPRHKNADTWLGEDTRGWGPPR